MRPHTEIAQLKTGDPNKTERREIQELAIGPAHYFSASIKGLQGKVRLRGGLETCEFALVGKSASSVVHFPPWALGVNCLPDEGRSSY